MKYLLKIVSLIQCAVFMLGVVCPLSLGAQVNNTFVFDCEDSIGYLSSVNNTVVGYSETEGAVSLGTTGASCDPVSIWTLRATRFSLRMSTGSL